MNHDRPVFTVSSSVRHPSGREHDAVPSTHPILGVAKDAEAGSKAVPFAPTDELATNDATTIESDAAIEKAKRTRMRLTIVLVRGEPVTT